MYFLFLLTTLSLYSLSPESQITAHNTIGMFDLLEQDDSIFFDTLMPSQTLHLLNTSEDDIDIDMDIDMFEILEAQQQLHLYNTQTYDTEKEQILTLLETTGILEKYKQLLQKTHTTNSHQLQTCAVCPLKT